MKYTPPQTNGRVPRMCTGVDPMVPAGGSLPRAAWAPPGRGRAGHGRHCSGLEWSSVRGGQNGATHPAGRCGSRGKSRGRGDRPGGGGSRKSGSLGGFIPCAQCQIAASCSLGRRSLAPDGRPAPVAQECWRRYGQVDPLGHLVPSDRCPHGRAGPGEGGGGRPGGWTVQAAAVPGTVRGGGPALPVPSLWPPCVW